MKAGANTSTASLRQTRRQLLTASLSALAGVALAGSSASFARSQDSGVTLTVFPVSFQVEAQPGDTYDDSITVRNDGGIAFGARAVVGPYPDAPETASAVSWITVEPEAIPLEPGGEGQFALHVTVPSDAKTGSYFARVTFNTDRASAEGQNVVTVAGAVAVLIVFTVQADDPLLRSTKIERIVPFLEPDGRLGFRAELVNTGNVHSRLAGHLDVLASDGSRLAALEFPDQLLLPGQRELIRATGTLPLPMGADYTAEALFTYGPEDDEQEVSAEVTFTFDEVAPPTVSLAMCENLDRGPTLTMHFSNDDEIGQVPQVTLRLEQDGATSAVTPAELANDLAIWPEDEAEVTADLPTRLETGRYTLIVEVSVGGGEPAVTEYPFEIGGNSPETLPLCSLLPAATPTA